MPPMRAAIRRALASPPPRGAVIVVVAGVVLTIAATVLSQSPGGTAGAEVVYQTQTKFPESPIVRLGKGGNSKIVGTYVARTAPNKQGERLFRVEASLRARTGGASKVSGVSCQLRFPPGVALADSGGQRAAFPPPLTSPAAGKIDHTGTVSFATAGTSQVSVELRNSFIRFVRGGNPSVQWPSIAPDQQSWLWHYARPVKRSRDNFAAILVAKGGEAVPITCNPQATGGATMLRPTVSTSVKLP